MTNQFLLIAALIACSIGGWYVVLSKYLELKEILKQKEHKPVAKAAMRKEPIMSSSFEETNNHYQEMPLESDFDGQNHIPGLGPPPLASVQFEIPPETLAAMRHFNTPPKEREPEPSPVKAKLQQEPHRQETPVSSEKRQICNWACILHISGLMFVTGIPFLNIILPAFLWLWIKEEHPYLVKQGREVINFQITLTLIMFGCLLFGTFFIWLVPNIAEMLFAWTKTLRVVFSSAMSLPFNMFTIIPFFWGCIMVIRGSVAAYHGVAFRYPLAQQFLFSGKPKLNVVNAQTT